MRKISVFILIFSFIFNFSNLSFASDAVDKYYFSVEKEYAELFLSKIGHPSTVSNPIQLKNIDGKLEALCFTIDNGGYLIININDLSIPELSFKNQSPFKNLNGTYIYNGPLAYFEKVGEDLISLKSGQVVKNKFKFKYYKDKIDKIKKLNDLKQEISIQGITIEKYLSIPLHTWYKPGGYCGSIAGAIVMMFYDEAVNDNYVDSNLENENLIDFMIPYIDGSEPGSSTSDLTNGLTAYLRVRNFSNTAISTSSYSFSTIKTKINNNRPIIIDTDNDPTYNEHWIIAHGYYVHGNNIDKYVIVNDGWGNNDVWLEADRSSLDDMVYLQY
ncbi:C39 family peptidase [Thermosediminibacter oceani]|uniref:Peptidase C39-like domain-containing protein n=1 Tax=Thermosediminibacter oceani (strain ATCC BAA-1034 / DSM 16646 / JW/IW-1228P) TaxID=555079 RepID=D9RZY0_THEOJ|nr:C39 family peptidase [Thermosediminibacter oceani]ADL08757.1 conserved hypothetical protein [Thermosediminibacter oceani DSM 16646]